MINLRAFTFTATVMALFGLLLCASCAKGPRLAKHPTEFIKDYDLKSLPKFDIPVEINDRVVAWIQYFQGPGRRHFERYLIRSGRYRELISQILKEEKVPQDLIYIALIESGFNPHAYSSAHAVGLWQFIKATGKRYGLNVDGWEDDRRDPYKSTRAAAIHFRDMYNDYGDWYLAMVGYNAGPGRVKKAVEITGSRNFWDMANHNKALRAETRDYIPKFMAAAIMAKMPERFGFKNIQYEKPLDFEIGEVDGQTDLKVIAECAGVDEGEMKILNAHFYRSATPPGGKYSVRLPRGTKDRFQIAYAKLPKEERIRIVQHRVQRGDTLSKIARKYGIRMDAIASANGLRNHSHISVGRLLTIPVKGSSAAYAAVSRESGLDSGKSAGSASSKVLYHTVKSGDTAGGVAKRYGVTVAKLREWNKLSARLTIRAGQKLKIYGRESRGDSISETVASKSVTSSNGRHMLAKGETLGQIAMRYGITTAEIMAWNDIDDPTRIHAGRILVVRGGEEQVLQPQQKAEITATRLESQVRGNFVEHKIKPGETLGGIASLYRVSLADLKAWNNIADPRSIKAGKSVKIMRSREVVMGAGKEDADSTSFTLPSGPSMPEHESSMEAASVEPQTTYTVRSGDTLWGIARKHNVTIAQIQQWNELKDPSAVKPGKKLTILKK